MTNWRFINSGHLHPAMNMAVDEALIEIYRDTGVPVFRIYGWKPHGFSIGYSQSAGEVLDTALCMKDNIPYVRRATGGGIIFHGCEVTYSLVCSEKDIGFPPTVKEGYKIICSFLLESYRRCDLNPAFSVDCGGGNKNRSTFCFASFEDYDILVDGRKIGGNAQKRLKKIILQHGSIPLELDLPYALKYVKEPLSLSSQKITSLKEAAGRDITFEEFSAIMKDSFRSVFFAALEEKKLTDEEMKLAINYKNAKEQKEKDMVLGTCRN